MRAAPPAHQVGSPRENLAQTEGQIFGGLPYRKFVHFYFFWRAKTSGALEHQDSYVAFVGAGAPAKPDDMVGLQEGAPNHVREPTARASRSVEHAPRARALAG
jgi:hypothetical protein